MKYLKMAALLAVLAGFMATAGIGSASATELTCGPSMCAAETTIKASTEGNFTWDAPFGNIVCSGSTLEGKASTGGASSTVVVGLSSLTFTGCGSNTFTVLASGKLEIHTEGATSNNNGTVTWTGLRATTIHLGVHCIFETNQTDFGTLEGSASTGGEATLFISARVPIREGEGGAFCGTSAPWTGSYRFTSPSPLNVD